MYRVAGDGPALVLLLLYRQREDLLHVRLLGGAFQVFQISPLGFGHSERVPGYAGEALADQVLAVLDRHGVERFIVWGWSKGGAMAACIARATPRCAGLVCGAYALLAHPTDGKIRQMDRRLRPDHPSRSLWTWVRQFDWAHELQALACPVLLYWGSEDRNHVKGLRRAQQVIRTNDVECIEFTGLGHEAGGDPDVLADLVIPRFVEWYGRRSPAAS